MYISITSVHWGRTGSAGRGAATVPDPSETRWKAMFYLFKRMSDKQESESSVMAVAL